MHSHLYLFHICRQASFYCASLYCDSQILYFLFLFVFFLQAGDSRLRVTSGSHYTCGRNSNKSSPVSKMLSNSITCSREIICLKKKGNCNGKLHGCVILRNCQSPHPSGDTTLIGQQPSASRQDPLPARRLQLIENSGDSIF